MLWSTLTSSAQSRLAQFPGCELPRKGQSFKCSRACCGQDSSYSLSIVDRPYWRSVGGRLDMIQDGSCKAPLRTRTFLYHPRLSKNSECCGICCFTTLICCSESSGLRFMITHFSMYFSGSKMPSGRDVTTIRSPNGTIVSRTKRCIFDLRPETRDRSWSFEDKVRRGTQHVGLGLVRPAASSMPSRITITARRSNASLKNLCQR